MKSAALERLEEHLEAILSAPPHERDALLDSRTTDPNLRAELASLVEAAEAAGPYFEALARAIPAILTSSSEARPQREWDLAPGCLVAHYRIDRELGRGGMGIVYRATDTRLDRQVALKLLGPHASSGTAAQERFLVEARAVAALDHPNVCALHDVGEDENGRTYLVMGYYDGLPLNRRIERGALSVDEALSYGRQIACALAAAHERGIVHRDIKPGNILVNSRGAIRVLDFGIAKLADMTLTGAGERLGTVAYMSPEQTNSHDVDRATDLWSLGAVLYEMLTGQRPFGGDDDRILIQAIRHDAPTAPSELRPDLPPDVEQAVLSLLSKTPAAREKGLAWLLGQSDRAGGASPASSGMHEVRARRLAAAAAACALALVAAALTLPGGVARADGSAEGRVAQAAAEPTYLVLADFASAPEDTALARTVTNALAFAVGQSQLLRFASPGVVEEILARMGKSGSPLDLPTALELAIRGGVPAVVSPQIRRVGEGFVLTAQVIEPDQQRTVAEAMSTASSENEVMQALDRLAKDLRAGLGESLGSLRQSPPLPEVTTNSIAALRLYLEGFNTPDERALGLLEEAVALDPGFALAWRRLAVELSNRSQQRSRQVEAFANAYEHRNRLSDKERAIVEATYFTRVAPRPERVIDVAETYLARYPDDHSWTDVAVREKMAIAYLSLRQPGRAEEALGALFRKYAPDWSCGTPVFWLAASLADQGRSAEAVATLMEEQDHCESMGRDRTPWVARDLALIAGAQGDYDLAEEQLHVALGLGADDPSWRAVAGVALSEVSSVRGRLGESRTRAEGAADAHRARGMTADALRVVVRTAARELYLTPDARLGTQAIDAELDRTPLAELDPLDRPYASLAVALARAGRTAEAHRLLTERDALADEAPERWSLDSLEIALARGELALAQHRYTDAIRAFRSADFGACSVCALPGLARAYDAAPQPDSAIAVLERYLATPDSKRLLSGTIGAPGVDHTFLGPALERLAQLHEGRGDASSAVARYSELVELWREADPELQPRVRAARARIAELERAHVP